MKRELTFPECHTDEDILNALQNWLYYETIVSDEEEARQIFGECYEDGTKIEVRDVLVLEHYPIDDEENRVYSFKLS